MATVFFLDDVHLSAEGHRVIGISLAKMFGEMGLGPGCRDEVGANRCYSEKLRVSMATREGIS